MADPVDPLPSSTTLLGRLLRLPLRAIPPGATVRILRGPTRGLRWIAGSGPHGCWLGINETGKRRRFRAAVRTGAVVYDIGAHAGSYTLLASVLAGPSGRVVAFEPLPANLRYLEEHIRLNRLTNVTVVAAALWQHTGTVRFHGTPDRVTSHVSAAGELEVPCTTLDALVGERRIPPPDCIKVDVEGAEVQVLAGASATLEEHRPVVFVATHGAEAGSGCRRLLEGASYRVSHVAGREDELVAHPRAREGEPDPANRG